MSCLGYFVIAFHDVKRLTKIEYGGLAGETLNGKGPLTKIEYKRLAVRTHYTSLAILLF